jgi:hypothetical protein
MIKNCSDFAAFLPTRINNPETMGSELCLAILTPSPAWPPDNACPAKSIAAKYARSAVGQAGHV